MQQAIHSLAVSQTEQELTSLRILCIQAGRQHHLTVNLSVLSAAKSTPTVKQECVCVFEEVSTTPGVRKAF